MSVAGAFGVRFAGVDFVTPDPAAPVSAGGAFIELNTTPGIHHHDVEPRVRPLPAAVRVLSSLLKVSPARVVPDTRESGKETP